VLKDYGVEVVEGRAPLLSFPVVAMTGHVDAEAQEQFREVGFRGCLGKPFSAESLKLALTQV
jgi:CheY-like chemotaxis protein